MLWGNLKIETEKSEQIVLLFKENLGPDDKKFRELTEILLRYLFEHKCTYQHIKTILMRVTIYVFVEVSLIPPLIWSSVKVLLSWCCHLWQRKLLLNFRIYLCFVTVT